MAELALAFFATAGTAAAGTAAAGAGAAASSALAWGLGTTVTTAAGVTSGLGAGSLAALAGAGSSALGVLQGVATASSMVSTLVGGVGKFIQGGQQADMAELQGKSDYLASEEEALRIRQDLVKKVGQARVAFAASGLDISSAGAVENDLTNQADFETQMAEANGQSRLLQSRMRAQAYRTGADFDLAGSVLKAGGQLAGYGLDIAKRG